MPQEKPLYIVFEGGEGSGKSTQSKLLAESLDESTVHTLEPGGTTLGIQLRELLLSLNTGELDPITEAYIMAGERAELMRRLVAPSLRRLTHIVSDRSFISAIAYQGSGRGLGEHFILDLNLLNPNLIMPDLVIIFDSPSLENLASRLKNNPDRFESAGDEFHLKVADSYSRMATILAENKKTASIKVVTIKQEVEGQPKSIDAIHKEVLKEVTTYCKEKDLVSPV